MRCPKVTNGDSRYEVSIIHGMATQVATLCGVRLHEGKNLHSSLKKLYCRSIVLYSCFVFVVVGCMQSQLLPTASYIM